MMSPVLYRWFLAATAVIPLFVACEAFRQPSDDLPPHMQFGRDALGNLVTNYKVGSPYEVAGVWYYPGEDYSYEQEGIASWYGPGFHGKRTANGETYDMDALTAAHRTLPMPSVVQVTNLENERSIRLRINDRGPFVEDRIIDVSRRAAQLLGFEQRGTARVRVVIVTDDSMTLKNIAQGTQKLDLPKVEAVPRPTIKVSNLVAPSIASGNFPTSTAAKTRTSTASPPTLLTSTQSDNVLPTNQAAPAKSASPIISMRETAARIAPEPSRLPAGALPDASSASSNRDLSSMPSLPKLANAPAITSKELSPVEVESLNSLDMLPEDEWSPAVSKNPSLDYFVQVGAFADRNNALRLEAQLKDFGDVFVASKTVRGEMLYRVRLGPIGDSSLAHKTVSVMKNAGYLDAIVVVE